MGQQMSAEDQDEGFKNVISRMLQEADEESEDSGKDEKKSVIKTESDTKLHVKHIGKKFQDEKLLEPNKEQNKNNVSPSDDVYKKAHLEPNNVEISSDTDKSEVKTGTLTNETIQEKIKNIKVEIDRDESTQPHAINDDNSKLNDSKTDSSQINTSGKTENTNSACEPSVQNENMEKSEGNDSTEPNKDKQRSLETVFLKDQIDNLITTCLSSKSSDLDIPIKTHPPPFINNQSPFMVRNQHISRSNSSQDSTTLSTYDTKGSSLSASGLRPSPSNDDGSQTIAGVSLAPQNKDESAGGRETTTFQTLIEKVLDNSLQRNKSVDSSQGNSNGFRHNTESVRQDNKILNRNIHTIKNEIRNELLVKDTNDKTKNDSKSEDMSINKSKVVYLKDHIEKVLEKSFQNSSRRDSDEAKINDTSLPEMPRRDPTINREPEHRERSHSSGGEPMMYRRDRSDSQRLEQGYQRERSNSVSKPPDYRRMASISTGETEVLGPPKLIKVTDMYPEMGRDQGRYLQPPRIDTYEGRGCYKSSMSPGGSYTRSPHSQSPVSPYYNNSPNAWHGHSPREHATVNMSPNHGVPSPNYQNSRYPHSPGMVNHMSRYPSVSHPSPPNNRGFHPGYAQNSPQQPFVTTGADTRHIYPAGGMKASPMSQHHSQMYSKQCTPASMMNYQSNELVSPRHESGQHYPQASARQHYTAEMSPMSTRSRMMYQTQAPPHMSQGMLIPHSVEHSPGSMQRMHAPHIEHPSASHHARHMPADHPPQSLQHMRQPDHPSIHHGRPTQMDQPPYPLGSRVQPNVYPDKSNRIAQHGTLQIPNAQYQKSSHYIGDRNANGRNPPISSAMAPAPRPPANFYRQQQPQRVPQLYPSSPPIPSVREYSRNVATNQGQVSSVPVDKFARSSEVSGNSNSRNVSNNVMKSSVAPTPAHEQALDFSVKRSAVTTKSSGDPELQPLDLTCKDKPKPVDTVRRSVGKGFSGFEYLAEGSHKKARQNRTVGRAEGIQNNQDIGGSRSAYGSPDLPQKSVSYRRHSSDGATESTTYDPAQHSPHGQPNKYKPPPGPSITQGTASPLAGKEAQITAQQDPKKGQNVSRHEPIQNILGSHSPSDILYLICRLCGQTYGSPYGFRKHFRNQHGFEPRSEHTIVQTISETKTAFRSPPVASNVSQAGNETGACSSKTVSDETSPSNMHNVSIQQETAASVNAQEKIVTNLPSESIDERMKMEELTDLVPGDRKFLECHECGQTFQLNDFGAYKRHCRQHGQPRIMNPFDTNYDVEQKSKQGEDRHKPLSEDSLHTCNVCHAQFSSADFMKNHMATAHSDNKQKPTTQGNSGDSKDEDLSTLSVKKRIMEDFQKGQFENTHIDTSKKVHVMKSAADSMVTTASPDSSSDKISSGVVDSQSDAPVGNTPSDKLLDSGKDSSDTGGCDSVKGNEVMETDTHYLHKKFGSKRKLSMTSTEVESKIVKKDHKELLRSPSVVSTNSCDSEHLCGVDGRIDVDSELESSSNLDSANEAKETDDKTHTGKPEARHQLPFVWDRVTRSQVGRKQTRVSDNP